MAKQFYANGAGADAFKPVDDFMETYMRQYDINGGAIAIAKDGRIVHAKGYNWAEPGGFAVMPTTLFRIASTTKVITGLLVHKLLETGGGKYTLDSLVWDLLPYKNLPFVSFHFDKKPANGNTPGKYFNAVTIRHLLNHQGGWGHDSTDPTFKHDQEIADAMNSGKLPVNKQQLLLWSVTKQGQQYYPGTQGRGYSNFGYLVLGMVIEQLTGLSYIDAVKKYLFAPLGITRPAGAGTTESERLPSESSYFRLPPVQAPCVTGKGGTCPEQYGSENIRNFDAFGGWTLSPLDYVKLLAAYRAADPAMPKVLPENLITWLPDNSISSKGTVYDHGGVLPGSWSYAARRADGVDFMVVWNTSSDKASFSYKGTSYGTGSHAAIWHQLLDAVTDWPSFDLTPVYFNSRSEWGWTAGSPRYDGVWNVAPDARRLHRGLPAADFQALYGSYYGKGLKLIFQQVYWQGGKELWDGIWAPNPNGQFVTWGAAADAFAKLYGDWWNKGFRLVHQQAFVKNGQTFYNGIWNPSTGSQFVSWEKNLAQFHQQYDEQWKKGFRLVHQQSYVKGGQTFYNGIWNPSAAAQFVAWEKTPADFGALYGQQWNAGFRLAQMQAVAVNGKLLYNGIWNPSTAGQYVSWGKDDELIEAEDVVLRSEGFQPLLLTTY